ncbi:YerC/YecD family TrpR-related protein [Patescibacteria group bacterium]
MPKVSKRLDDPEKLAQYYSDFIDAFDLLESWGERESFLYEILTRTELRMLAKRFQVALMLVKGKSYQVIQDEVNVSENTISRISNWLTSGINTFFDIVKRLDKEKESRPPGKYTPGDLLSPLINDGLHLASQNIKQKQKKKMAKQHLKQLAVNK